MASDNGQFHSRQLLDLSPPEIRAYLETDDTILIPLGACEMHGDHMPLGTDIYNAMEVSPAGGGEGRDAGRAADLERLLARTTCASPSAGWGRSRCARRRCWRSSTTPPAA